MYLSRFGTYGVAVTIISDRQLSTLDELCDTLDINITDLPDEIPHDTYVYELKSIEEKKAMAALATKRNDVKLAKTTDVNPVPAASSSLNRTIKTRELIKRINTPESTSSCSISINSIEQAAKTKIKDDEALNSDVYFQWIADSISSNNNYTNSPTNSKYEIDLPWTSAWDDY